ncbi:Acyl-CoA dehydrogenase family member 11 [Mytilus edulis]|uniref:Acyl-CoA dehydrogenase family member 11 n=1 Tax=Mytilus edulis TaxID=6550 RepID=A0A8S3VH60_MYTED|nr:Acyl-CoA dehydrogenase family member 11 [Mytilus edulis]
MSADEPSVYRIQVSVNAPVLCKHLDFTEINHVEVSSGTETVAVEQDDGSYRLHGYKWFSSATDSDMAFTLARVVDKQNNVIEGTKGLSLFYLETKKNDGSLNNIQIIKLKDKLGTRQLPTAELLLDGTSAVRISDLGKGVAGISSMLTLTRIHNAVAACSSMRKLLMLSKDYSLKREAFGNRLYNYPLHVQTLARLETEVRAATLFVFQAVLLLSKQESGNATEDELHLLRLLTPLIKLYTGKQKLSRTPSELSKEAEKLQMALKSVLQFVTTNQGNLDVLTFAARDLSYSLSRIYMGTLMIEHTASCEMSPVDIHACKRWCEQQLSLVSNHDQYSKQSSDMDKELVYG